MLSAGLPLIFYNLTGKRKEDIHEQVLEYRASLEDADENNHEIEYANA